MNSDLNENVTITLPKSVCLVLFELLTGSYEQWRKTNSDDASASPMLVTAEEHVQRVALWRLEGSLERTLPELFASNYDEMVTESKCLLSSAG